MNNEIKPNDKHVHVPLEALHIVEATSRYFRSDVGEDVEGDVEELPDIELADHERTPSGFIELGWDHLETQKSLHFDLRYACKGKLSEWPPIMQKRAHAAVDKFNQSREVPVSIDALDPTFLFRISEPVWTEEKPEDWPEDFQPDLEMLAELSNKLEILSRDESLKKEALEQWQERSEVMRQAAGFSRKNTKIDRLTNLLTNMRMDQAASGSDVSLSVGKRRRMELIESQIAELQANLYTNDLPEHLLPDLAKEVERRDRKELKKQFDKGLVLTDQMKIIIKETAPSLMRGNPALFTGETGGAKTALAIYLAIEIMRTEPEIISGYADVNGYQLIGKTGLTTKDGHTISEFINGPVVRAMEEGRCLILDEINAMPPEFLKRLNIITQLRPGEDYTIQEDSGKKVTVAQGFCIIATANEKSKRYQGLQPLSTEFRNRFAANGYHVAYPDSDVITGQHPLDNYKIAHAAASDKSGELRIDQDLLERFAMAAHMTQRLSSLHIDDGLGQDERDVIGSERLADKTATGLDEYVIAPRTMVDFIGKVIGSHGSLTLQSVLYRWLTSIHNKHDQKVIEMILKSRNLLPEPNKDA